MKAAATVRMREDLMRAAVRVYCMGLLQDPHLHRQLVHCVLQVRNDAVLGQCLDLLLLQLEPARRALT
jgi:hypothetical protein